MNIDVNALQLLPEIQSWTGLKKTCIDEPAESIIVCKEPTCKKTVVKVVDLPPL